MAFRDSTQFKYWTMSPDEVRTLKRDVYEDGCKRYKIQNFTFEQCENYIQFYLDKLISIINSFNGTKLHLNRFQKYAATTYYSRVYLRTSIWDIPPAICMICSLFIIMKLNYMEQRLSLGDLINKLRLSDEFLNNYDPLQNTITYEKKILVQLNCQLKVHLPFHHLHGLVDKRLSKEDFEACQAFICRLLVTEAIFVGTPSEIAYASIFKVCSPEKALELLGDDCPRIPEENVQRILKFAENEPVNISEEKGKELEESFIKVWIPLQIINNEKKLSDQADKSTTVP